MKSIYKIFTLPSIKLFERSMENFSFFCSVLLILVWPLAGMIAGRNIILGIGCLVSLTWIICVRPKITLQMVLPALLLLAVPGWLWIHYFFLPTDTAAQLYDLKGTWLRAVLAVVFGTTLGLITVRSPKMMIWIGLAMTALALTTLARFILEILFTHQWVISDFHFPFKYKIAVVYFLMYPCLLAYAFLHYCSLGRDTNTKNNISKLGLGLAAAALATICWIDFIAAHALNGVLAAGFMGVILLLIYLMQIFWMPKSINFIKLLLLGTAFLVLATSIMVFWKYDHKYEQKLGNLIGDMQVSAQGNKHLGLRGDPAYQGPKYPRDSADGRVVNGSTYERTTWFIKGIELLVDHPFGTGFSHLAFKYFMLQEDPDLNLTKTHSGWLDYALGIGLPGLLLTWLAMGLVVYRSIRGLIQGVISAPLALSSSWILVGIWVLWWPAELSEREFIEYLFLMIALLGAAILPQQSQSPAPLK